MNKTLLFEQMIAMRRYPKDAPKILERIRNERWARIVRAHAVRNFLLPVEITFAGIVGEVKTAFTPAVGYELLVLGATARAGVSDLTVRPNATAQADWSDVPIMAQAIAGFPNFAAAVPNIGQQDVLDFPVPFVLGANEQLAVDFVNRTATGVTQKLVFHCLQVLPETNISAQFRTNDRLMIEEEIANNSLPRMIYLRIDVAANKGKTRVTDVPLLVLGASMNYGDDTTALVKLTTSYDNYAFSEDQVPAWSMAAQIQSRVSTFLHFQRPHYLPRGAALSGEFLNANGLQMIFKCQTP
jgi:hypothetical protein